VKRCGRCKVIKNKSDFALNKSKKDGLQALCRECKKISQRKYYAANKQSYRDTNNKSRRERILRNRKYVLGVLSSSRCMDCGEADVRVLEFDHVRGDKVAGVGRMVYDALPLSKIKEEIKKCEVRCCNCHRIVTYERRGIVLPL
jgi:hypothetical protein